MKKFKTRAVVSVFPFGAAYFFSNFHRMSLGIIGEDIAAEMNLTGQQLGTLGSSIFYAYALMQIPCGVFADRIAPKKMVGFSCLLTAFSTLLFVASRSFGVMVAARTLTGIGTALVYVPALVAIRQDFSDENLGLMTGILVAMGQMGSLSASLPLKLIADAAGWKAAFYVIGGISVALGVACLVLIRGGKGSGPKKMDREKADSKENGTITTAFLSLAVWFFITGGARLSFQSLWGSRYFVAAMKLNPYEIGTALMCISVGCIVGPMVLGRVSDLMGNIRTVLVSSTLFSAVWVVLGIFGAGTSSVIVNILCILLGVSGAGGFTIGFCCIRNFVGKGNTGKLTGINNCCAFLGSAIFTQFSGSVVQFFSTGGPDDGYRVLMLIFGALSGAATVGVWGANVVWPKTRR